METVKKKIKDHLESKLFNNIIDNENLFSSSMIDSFGLIELVVYIEKEFNIDINYEDLNEDNFSSVNSISSFVCNSLNG